MEGCSKNRETCPLLLNLFPEDRERNNGSIEVSEKRKLELNLLQHGEDWFREENNKIRDESLLSIGCFSSMTSNSHKNNIGIQNQKNPLIFSTPWCSGSSPSPSSTLMVKTHQQKASFLQFPRIQQSLSVIANESSQICSSKVAELQNLEKKASSSVINSDSANTAAPNSSQKRSAPAPVVGWPPIRSFRKNISSISSTKFAPESEKKTQTEVANNVKPESCNKNLFVKINMDGIPIGRKVDLKAYTSYEKLSYAVDELFRDLLAAQGDSCSSRKQETKAITGLLDGSGEYTLVYEDNEGDRMLVGDVPWDMFVGSVRRLWVLKSSELSAFRLGTSKQEKTPLNSGVK